MTDSGKPEDSGGEDRWIKTLGYNQLRTAADAARSYARERTKAMVAAVGR